MGVDLFWRFVGWKLGTHCYKKRMFSLKASGNGYILHSQMTNGMFKNRKKVCFCYFYFPLPKISPLRVNKEMHLSLQTFFLLVFLHDDWTFWSKSPNAFCYFILGHQQTESRDTIITVGLQGFAQRRGGLYTPFCTICDRSHEPIHCLISNKNPDFVDCVLLYNIYNNILK